jgi:hypothetical protein
VSLGTGKSRVDVLVASDMSSKVVLPSTEAVAVAVGAPVDLTRFSPPRNLTRHNGLTEGVLVGPRSEKPQYKGEI